MPVVLANLFFIALNIGGEGTKFLTMSIGVGDSAPVTYDLVQLLIILGIAVVAAVILERLLHQGTPGGLLGAFFLALLGIVLFITFVPLVWKGDFNLDGIPLITALIGAILALLIGHFLFGGLGRRSVAGA
ncbi:MAG TPA: hypothetical protein VH540_24920 [Ktedonobacterales bacterium]|jgi:hypothetical protein